MRSRNFSRCVPRSRNGTSLYAFQHGRRAPDVAGIGIPEVMGKSSADAIRMVLEDESLHVPNKNDPVLVGKYSSTMRHIGLGIYWNPDSPGMPGHQRNAFWTFQVVPEKGVPGYHLIVFTDDQC